MNKTPILLTLLLLLAPALTLATQPTQQFNKIYLNPYYKESINLNTNYTYTITVNPPDGISKVTSSIIAWNAQINGQTQNFSILVNGKACNTPNYYIATAFSTTGNTQFSFDCSNIINQTGTYTITLRSAVNTGAVSGWLDLTYMNKPAGEIKIHGTEYVPGDVAKLFLQFLDSQNNAVTNSECFVSLWYPNDTLIPTLNNTLMSKLNNATEGIYYKNYNVPNVTGVYPASAKCYRPLTFYNKIVRGATTDNFESNSWVGGTGWSTCNNITVPCTNGWDIEDTVPLATIVTNATAACYNGSFCAKLTGSYGFIERGWENPNGIHAVNITYWFKFKGFQTNEHFNFFIFDGNWHLIDSIGASATYGSYTNLIWYKKTYQLTEANYELEGAVLLGWYATKDTPSTSDEFYIDDISIDQIAANVSISNETEYQILRGAGEVHVSNLYNNLQSQINSINITATQATGIAEAIWNYTNKSVNTDTLFVGGTEYLTTQPARISARITSGANNQPVDNANCNVTILNPDLTLFIGNATMTQPAITGVYTYNFTTPATEGVYTYGIDCTKTGSKYYLMDTFHVSNTTTLTAQAVWQYNQTISTNILTQIAQKVWDFISGQSGLTVVA